MFDSSSRYSALPDAVHQGCLYKTRRLLPQPDAVRSTAVVRVADEDRLDLIAYRTLGNALSFWRVADANGAMDPAELTERPGRLLRIPETVSR